MRILYLASSALPSHDRANSIQVMQMCQAFARDGHEIRLLAPDRPERIPHADPYRFYGIESTFPIEWLPWLPIKGRGYLYAWLAARRARQLQPDLVYTRSIAGCFFSTKLGLPAVLELHDPISSREPLLKFMFIHLLSSTKLKRVVATSGSLAGHLQNRYEVSEARLCVAPNGAADNALSGKLLDLDRHGFHAGYIGGLRSGKGMELLAKLPLLTPQVNYHVVGGSPLEVQHWRGKLKDIENITFYGQVQPSEADKYRRSFDVLLAPYQRMQHSLVDEKLQTRWLSPLKIIEYMAAGKPIICSELPVYREILKHERTALLCDPDDVQGWAAAVERLRADADLRNALGRAAHDDFRKHYTWRSRSKRVLESI